MNTLSATLAVTELQHDDLRAFEEHDEEFVECFTCGRQWAIHGSDAEIITEGDGFCDGTDREKLEQEEKENE